MKLVKSSDASIHKNSEQCIAIEYPMDDKDINVAYIKISGRYPDKGTAKNKVCKELGYIVKGKGKIIVNGESSDVEVGDAVMVEPGEDYYWEGNLELVVPCSPAWYPEQHEVVG